MPNGTGLRVRVLPRYLHHKVGISPTERRIDSDPKTPISSKHVNQRQPPVHHFSPPPSRELQIQINVHHDRLPRTRYPDRALFPNTAPQPTPRPKAQRAPDPTRRITDPIRDAHLLETHPDPPLRDRVDDVDDAKGRATQGAEDGDGGDGPEDELEVEIVRDVGAVEGL